MPQSWEIEGFLEIQHNHLHIDGVSAVELVKQHDTPLFVFSESRIRHNIDRLKRAAEVIDCPLKICYAAKAMSTMGILKAVKDAGADIEVNSGGELWKALKIGFTGEQIIFNGTSKEVWEIEMAINAGIYAIQVDSLYELSMIEQTAARLGKRANVSLRLVPEIESDTHSGLQTALLTSKFGMMPDEAFAGFRKYKDSANLELCGIHLHIGSQNPDPAVYSEAFSILFDSLQRIFRETGIKLQHINLGGGFPVNYLRSEERYSPELKDFKKRRLAELRTAADEKKGPPFIAEVKKRIETQIAREKMLSAGFEPVDAIQRAWENIRQKALSTDSFDLLADLTLLLEPGRSIISDTGICLTTVRNIKKRPLTEITREINERVQKRQKESSHEGSVNFGVSSISRKFNQRDITDEHWLMTDAGFNILLSMETYKWYYDLISAERSNREHNFPYKVAGPLCDGGDVYFDIEGEGRLPNYRLLPDDAQPGEILALLNCGAYSLAQASQYNGRFLPAVALIGKNGSTELIRKRDTFEDLIANDVL